MDSSVSLEDRIWFLRVCHHVPFALYYEIPRVASNVRKNLVNIPRLTILTRYCHQSPKSCSSQLPKTRTRGAISQSPPHAYMALGFSCTFRSEHNTITLVAGWRTPTPLPNYGTKQNAMNITYHGSILYSALLIVSLRTHSSNSDCAVPKCAIYEVWTV